MATGRRSLPLGIATALSLAAAPAARAQDLATAYPATLDFVEDEDERVPHLWTSGPEDVWNLRGFTYEIEDALEVKLGSGNLVVGQSDGNALWAVFLPDRSAKLSTTKGGDGERVTSVYLRFHPSRIGDVIPAKTVRGRGDEEALYWAYRVYRRKIYGEWNYGNLPVVPPKDLLVLDMDTEENRRRVFTVDMRRGRVDYKSGYVTGALPVLESVNKRTAYELVENAWREVDRKYALFGQTEVDWASCLDVAKSDVARAKSTYEVGIGIRKMLDRLGDDDLWVYVGQELVSRSEIRREFNARWSGISYVLGDVKHDSERGLAWARTPHDVGYLNLRWFDDEECADAVDEALAELGDTWSMIVDMRFTRYGEREVAERIAGRFLKEPAVYGYVQKRGGAGHDEFAEAEELTCEPSGEWTYEAPLYLLVGPGTARRGEQLALMLQAAKKVVVCGSPTLGLNSNNEEVELGSDLTLILATARDLDADGNVLKGAGIAPDLAIDYPEDTAAEEDPVLFRALEEVLKTPHAERKPGNPGAPPSEEGGEAGDGDDEAEADGE